MRKQSSERGSVAYCVSRFDHSSESRINESESSSNGNSILTGNSNAYEAKVQGETVGKSRNREWQDTVLSTVLVRFASIRGFLYDPCGSARSSLTGTLYCIRSASALPLDKSLESRINTRIGDDLGILGVICFCLVHLFVS